LSLPGHAFAPGDAINFEDHPVRMTQLRLRWIIRLAMKLTLESASDYKAACLTVGMQRPEGSNHIFARFVLTNR
jgi:hypothetical protein